MSNGIEKEFCHTFDTKILYFLLDNFYLIVTLVVHKDNNIHKGDAKIIEQNQQKVWTKFHLNLLQIA